MIRSYVSAILGVSLSALFLVGCSNYEVRQEAPLKAMSGKLDRIDTVAKALDHEGRDLQQERTDCVGTRHHSAYSLCSALHDALALVVSQDGTVQLAKWNKEMVTIWDQLSLSLTDV